MKLTDNTLKYLKEYGGLSFGERPFSHVDSLILCQLSYFKFQDLVPDLVEKMDGNDIRGVTMRSLRKHPKYNSLYVSDWYEKDNRRLYAAVARSRRFAKMRLNYYTNLTDKEMQMQFSAVTFLLEDGTVYVAFRGTDETIVGWREDFDMALKSPIPSQTAARLYLRHIAEYTGDAPLMIGGHSKGGNEAVFAAMETEPQIQDRIRAVYCFDGPGFREDIYRKEGYLRIEKKIIKHNIHFALFCSPHNPTGRVWKKEEIQKFMDICKKHDVLVFSDEIWADLVRKENTHIPTQFVSEDAKKRTIAAYAPSKTFNLAGLVGSYHIVYDKYLRDRLNKQASLSHYNSPNILSIHALIGAYCKDGLDWVSELNEVIANNVDFAIDFIHTHFKGIEVIKPEGTYMLYLDCTKYLDTHDITMDELLKKGVRYGVCWQDGRPFMNPNTIRMNLALPTSLVEEAFSRLKEFVF